MNYHDPVDPMLKQFLKSRAQDLVIPNTVENAVGNALSSLSDKKVKKRFPLKRWRWALAIVAFFFILGAVSILTVPTFAEVIRSLFAKDNPDIGLLRAQELGLVINPHIKVKDKGYTLVINEAVADPTRVTIALQLFDENGKHDRDKLGLGDENKITIKDDKGNVVGSMYDMGYTSDFYYMVDFFSDPLRTDKITIEGSIGSLGQSNETLIKGNWDFSFDIDMKEANKQKKIEELAGSYTTPHGMKVTLKRLTRMVQGVRFELETELDDRAMARSSGDLWKKQMLSFHFETTDGEEIHSVNPRKTGYMDSLMTSDHRVIGNGKMHWSYTFKYLPEDEPYRFVLDAYSVAEMDGSKISFRPSELTEPKAFKIMNDRLELVRASLEKSQVNKGAHETVISFYGKMDNEIMHEEWRAYDSAGKQYDVLAVGASTIENTLTNHWREGYISMGDRKAKQPYEFRITRLNQIPKELILVREVVDKRYKDPDWTVLLK
ncbi:DUF4179 domain-containing protein [Paenibacillus sp. EKM211P]|uniref:DUF4179 domain-containing protein n=1 Tax=Paenibacillus sp. EKM211P TaxID=1683679 RepID=UPI0013E97C9C|nr:DUF4179 domain-containing protein [Paenibacillus sp. EKM211P]KAF6580611.1 DUF4179 domain-containing protein [Paenibacillus sp. EKM211P]